METSVVVTGLGLTTCLGTGVEESWRNLLSGRSGMSDVTSFPIDGSKVLDAGEAAPFDESVSEHEKVFDRRERARKHLERACREALRNAGLDPEICPDPPRAALVLGSSLAASATSLEFWNAYIDRGPGEADYAMLRSYDVEPMIETICREFDIQGEARLVSNACAAGASCITLGADLLRLNRADFVICVGYDTLELHTFAGFHSIGALSKHPLHPFSKTRAGMKLSDGVGVVILEREKDARAAGRKLLARLLGRGESADAHHLTQPAPDGSGAALAMQRALDRANLKPYEIDFVSLHATATPSNDLAEYRALRTVFGEDTLRTLPLHAAKPALGHSLGAAGAVEAILSVLALRDQRIPPTLGVIDLEEEMGELSFLRNAEEHDLRAVMSNSFGFGGCNASLIFGVV